MEDYFAIFEEPRRPWLDADALKEKFHRLTASHHPDVAARSENRVKNQTDAAAKTELKSAAEPVPKSDVQHNVKFAETAKPASRDFSEINRAYQTLSDLPARLRHLLALEFPEINTRQLPISDELSTLFLAISENQHALITFLAKQARATSPLAKALLAPEQFELLDATQKLSARIANHEAETERAVRELDAHCGNLEIRETEKKQQGAELAALYQSSAFLKKWSTELREAMMRLHG